MRIQVLSDLHLEFHNPLPGLADGVDVIVCAGDLAPVETGAVFYAAKEWADARHILYVPGNHEYYGTDIDVARRLLAKQCRHLGITLLDPGTITVDNVRFIGATLWTDFRLNGIAHEAAAHKGALGMADFTGASQRGRTRFTTHESARRHAAERAFIEGELASARRVGQTAVVITHHAPTPRSIAPHFERHPCNPGFASDLDDLIERYQPALWVHGHMHDVVDVEIGATRVLCNPAGYNPEKNAKRGYDPALCVEIT